MHLLKLSRSHQYVREGLYNIYSSWQPFQWMLSQGQPDNSDSLSSTEHIETMMQLLTAVVKKFPLIVPDKSEWPFSPIAFKTNSIY